MWVFRRLRTFNAVIGLWYLHVFWGPLRLKWGVVGVKMGKGMVRCLPTTNSFLLSGFLRLCQFRWKSIKKCERESARTRTHWQRQTGFIMFPLLYGIAVGQIIRNFNCGYILDGSIENHSAKFLGDWSNRYWDLAIFYFQNGSWPPPWTFSKLFHRQT